MIVLRAWLTARTWRELAYLVSGVFIGLPAFVLAVVGAVTTVASALTVGLPLLVGVLALARLTPRYFRGPARKLLGWHWADPPPLPARTWWGRVRALPSDPTAWRALAYCLARWPLAVVGAYPGLFAVVAAPVGITYPLWWFLVPADGRAFDTDTWSHTWVIAWQGLAVLLATPWWLRLVVLLDRFLVRALLHPSQAQRRIAELEAGRAALQSDAAALLRRVERDLHDGTQARLVALGLTLSRIENRSTDEPVRKLAADARGTVTEALAELRDIVRGMHPPALDDGLEVALTTLAARSAVPAEVTVSLPGRPPDATASALYFAVAELLTNVARHGDASRVRIDLRTENRCLRLTVTDNGHGGAAVIAPGSARSATDRGHSRRPAASGTGLAGLARRAAALDGSLTVDSPPGGPTIVTMILPEIGD
ncbi:sensor histidine kinase [Actinoplanes sp. NPDC004185]